MKNPGKDGSVDSSQVFMKLSLGLFQGLRFLATLDLLSLLWTGGYRLVGTHLESRFPCTSVFLILLTTLLIHGIRSRLKAVPASWLSSDWRVFLLVWLLFLSNFRWGGSGDTVSASVQPFALIQYGNLYLDPYCPGLDKKWANHLYVKDGHILSGYPSVPGILLLPVDLLPALAGVHPTELFLHQTQKIGASLMVALSVIFVLKTLLLFMGRREALLLAAAYAFGTSAFSVSSQAIWQHSPGQLFIAMGLWAIFRAVREKEGGKLFGLAGFAFAMATLCRYPNLALFLVVLVWMLLKSGRKLVPFLLGALAPFMALAWDNYFHTGIPWQTGYGEEAGRFSTPLLEGLAGVLLSPSRGLFLYSPVLLFAFYGSYRTWSSKGTDLFKALLMGACGVLWIVAKWHAWSGGWCFGPRLLADITPVLILAIAPALPGLLGDHWTRFWFRSSILFSIMIHSLGVYLTWWWEPDSKTAGLWEATRHPLVFLILGKNHPEGPGRILQGLFLGLLILGLIAWVYRDTGSRGSKEGLNR